DVEHVARAFAEGRDMGGGNVEVELRDRGRQLIQQAGAVEAGNLDHGVAVRPLIVDGDLRLDHESAHLAAVGRLAGHHLGQPPLASSKPTLIASWCPACSLARMKRAWRILRCRSTLSQ